MVGIYKITNIMNRKSYIGQSKQVERRIREHKIRYTNDNSPSFDYPLYRSMRKYGVENFAFEVLEECSIEELDIRELYYINYYNTFIPYGYNQALPNQKSTTLTPPNIKQIILCLETTELSDEQIGIKFNVSDRAIRAINYGESWRQDGIKYPIKDRRPSAPIHYCPICGVETKNKIFCSQICSHKSQQQVDRPSIDTLAHEIFTTNFSEVGRKYKVDGNAIRKWCKAYNIPSKSKEFKAWYINKYLGEK